MNNIKIIKESYTILNEETPLKFDCGFLCNSHCCKNNSEDEQELGMWLLPGEKDVLKKCKAYTFYKGADGTETLVCNGSCNRDMRPYACRIYPYYPCLTKSTNGKIEIKIKIDPRSRISCPIARFNNKYRPNIFFLSALKRSTRILIKSQEISQELFKISDFLSEIEKMQAKLLNL